MLPGPRYRVEMNMALSINFLKMQTSGNLMMQKSFPTICLQKYDNKTLHFNSII
jgi:hypothetical protein